jgi:hypothetical protein
MHRVPVEHRGFNGMDFVLDILYKVVGMKHVLTAFLILFAASHQAKALNGVRGIEETETGYIFTFWFETELECDSVFNLLYNFDHVQQYSTMSTMHLLRSEKDWYAVEMEFNHMFYNSKQVYVRKRMPREQVITIEMIKFWHNRNMLPKIEKSLAKYSVHRRSASVTLIEYEQAVTFERSVGWVYMKIIRNGLNNFADELLRYVDKKSIEQKKVRIKSARDTLSWWKRIPGVQFIWKPVLQKSGE